MHKVKLPTAIRGNWIWLKGYEHRDSFLLFRKEFYYDQPEKDIDLWISANTAYQLFVNDRLVGFGPSGHPNSGNCYIDQHNSGIYLESGLNVVAVKVFYNTSCSGELDERPPGFWCQMMAENDLIICSDESWNIFPGDFCSGLRPQIAAGEGLIQHSHSENCPQNWNSVDFKINSAWKTPDIIVPIEKFPLRPELFPMPVPVVSPEQPEFKLVEHGYIAGLPAWSAVQFKNTKYYRHDTFAAVGYILSEKETILPMRVYTDDPYKLYNNLNLIADAPASDGSTLMHLHLSEGWNKLMLLQTPTATSMGFMMVFPENQDITVLNDPIDSAAPGWNIAGPLRLTMMEATPSIHLENLRVERCSCNVLNIPSMDDLLDSAILVREDPIPVSDSLKQGEYRVWKLPRVCYGFLQVSVEGAIGDVVDIALSTGRSRNGFVGTPGRRSVGTLYCRGGISTYLLFVPEDCLYAGVLIRSTRNSVRILDVEFRELTREMFRTAEFKCSDERFNRIWKTGYETLCRSISMIPLADSRRSQDVFLFDAFAEAVNAAALFGDPIYTACRLRQFLDAQIENGDIPAITHGERRELQLNHMLFLPRWIMHNYSFSGSMVELERCIPALTQVRELFESMIDPEYGLLVFPSNWYKAYSRLSYVDFQEGKISSCLSSLFCRFLLTASDVYRIAGQKGDAAHCLRLADTVAECIRHACKDDETGLFYSWAGVHEEDEPFNCFCNFCAMYAGVMNPDDFETFFYAFFNYDPPFDKYNSLTPYGNFLFTEMMFACGQRKWMNRYLIDYWEKRLAPDDSGWLDSTGKAVCRTAFVCGESISPNVFLIREVLGIRHGELDPGVLYFHPGADFVDQAEGSVPLSNGRILVQWKKTDDGGLDVMLDSNVPVSIMPEISLERLKKISFRLSENVTLLKPPAEFEDDIEF